MNSKIIINQKLEMLLNPDRKLLEQGLLVDPKNKSNQQWEMLASHGHQLLAQVQAWEQKARKPYAILFFAIALAGLTLWLAPPTVARWSSSFQESFLSWASNLGQNDVEAENPDAAPYPMGFAPIGVPAGKFAHQDDVILLPAGDLEAALPAFAERLKTGGAVEGCRNSKLSDAWGGDGSGYINCRKASDGSRLWIWGAVGSVSASSNGYLFGKPFMVVIRKAKGGVVETFNVEADRASFTQLGNYPQVALSSIPRAFATDFPEQTTNTVKPKKAGAK